MFLDISVLRRQKGEYALLALEKLINFRISIWQFKNMLSFEIQKNVFFVRRFLRAKMQLSTRYFLTSAWRLRAAAEDGLTESKQSSNPRPFKQMPEVKGFPLIGTVLDYTRLNGFDSRFLPRLWAQRHEANGDIFKENLPGFGCVVFCRSPEDTRAMIRADSMIRMPGRPPLEASKFIKRAVELPESLSNLNGNEWYQQRKVINKPLLNNKMVWKYVSEQHEVAKEMVEYIDKHLNDQREVNNFDSVLNRWAFEMSGIFLLNTKLGLLKASTHPEMSEIFQAQTALLEFLSKSVVGLNLWKYFRTRNTKVVIRQVRRSGEIINNLLAKKQNSAHMDGTVLGDVLEARGLTKEQKISLVHDVVGASIETTSKAFALVMYSLSQHPKEQEKLRIEILSLPETVTGRMMDGMTYMNAFIKETVRLFPFAHAFMRFYKENIVLSGYAIPAGTKIINTANSTLNTDARYFSDPEQFLPERWLNVNDSINKFHLTGPFGQGPRACPGRRFAMQEIRLLLIEMLKNFKIEYHYKPMISALSTTGTPSEPPQFTFIPVN